MLGWILVAQVAVVGDLVLNEVLYDPPGPDAGREFVELFNPTSESVDLAGLELWFRNGSAPEPPRVVWRAGAGRLEAGRHFVIGEADVAGADAVAALGLQNGDEALWLVRDGVRVDALAWGEGVGPWGEGSSAERVSARSLGRVPDGVDRDDNRSDWIALPEITPGAINLAAHRFDAISARSSPLWSESPVTVRIEADFVAKGWASPQTAILTWVDSGERLTLDAARGDTVRVERSVVLDVGSHRFVVECLEDDLTRSIELLSLRIGVSDLVVTEIQARPLAGEPEWIEVLHRGSDPLDPSLWKFADAAGSPRALTSTTTAIAAGARFLVTADAEALRSFHGLGPDVPCFEPASGWPSLNDTASDGNPYADVLRLYADDGVLVDRIEVREEWLKERGRSVQRGAVRSGVASVWLPSAAAPTPGRANPAEVFGGGETGLVLSSDPFHSDSGSQSLQIRLVEEVDDATAMIRDLAGDLVRVLDGAHAEAIHHWQWDGRDDGGRLVPSGAYVVSVRLRRPGGVEESVRRLVVVVAS